MPIPGRTTKAICSILAPSYHGVSTLSWRLNTHPDILSLGSGNPLRDGSQICSCGEAVSSCPFWSELKKKLEFNADDPIKTFLPPSPFISANETFNTRVNGLISLIANEVSPKTWKIVYESAERFLNYQDKFLSYIAESVPHKTYADAERSTVKFMVLSSMGFPVKGVIHLVRDPRGYVAAWKRYYPEMPVEKLTLDWSSAHTRLRRLKQFFPKVPFLTIKYEDLMEKPIETMKRCNDFMGLKEYYAESAEIGIGKNHMIGLREQDYSEGFAPQSENWPDTLHPEDQDRVLKVAGPLFSEFGYKA